MVGALLLWMYSSLGIDGSREVVRMADCFLV